MAGSASLLRASTMTTPPMLTDTFVSTFLVNNIHCPSCVSYASDVLSAFAEVIHRVDISIIDHTIRVQHDGQISAQLAEELSKAAFDVEHVTVTDHSRRIVQDLDVEYTKVSSSNVYFRGLFMTKTQKKHIRNCSACQEQKRRRNIIRKASSRVSKTFNPHKWSTSTDVEQGEPESTIHRPTDNSSLPDQSNSDGGLSIAIFSIEGMTCASCVSAITSELERNEHVRSTSINLVANNAKVIFRHAQITPEAVANIIEDVGYGATIEEIKLVEHEPKRTEHVKASITIDGMTCGSCVGAISRGIQELPFVQHADVDLVSNSAHVIFRGKHNLDAIITKIDELGYDAKAVRVDSESNSSNSASPDRIIQVQIEGMYCPKCPAMVTSTIDEVFSGSVLVTQGPTLTSSLMVVKYRPSPPELTIRRIIEVLNSIDPAYSATVYHAPSLEQRSRRLQQNERNRILRHLVVTLLVAVPSFIIGIVFMSLVSADNPTRKWFEEPIWAGDAMRMDWALFIMTTPVMFYGANLFHLRALKELWALWRLKSSVPVLRRFYRFGSMNLLISAGTSVAYFASITVLAMDATSAKQEHGMGRKSSTYFDTVTFLTLFVLIGRFLEAYSKAKTGDAVSMLAKLRPATALLAETKQRNAEQEIGPNLTSVSVDLLEVNDSVSIPHGACPPTDGIIAQEGKFLFDESSLTGESKPSKKGKGDKVYTGSVNLGDPVRVVVSEVGEKSLLDQIVNVVRDGQAKRAPIERLADALTGYFTPVITLLAILTWVVWLALGTSGSLPRGWLDVDKGGWAYWSVEFAIAVFVVACPCGIGLAAPTALFVGGGLAARHGILVQGGGEAFQEASKLDTIVFDKTGTLTEGRMKVTDVDFIRTSNDVNKRLTFTITKTLEEASTHPIAKAVVERCDVELEGENPVQLTTLEIREIPGQGMSGRFEVRYGSDTITYEAVIGNERLLNTIANGSVDSEYEKSTKQANISCSDTFLKSTLSRLQSLGNSTAILAICRLHSACDKLGDYNTVTVFAITDPVRDEAYQVLTSLRAHGVDVHMCTGDNSQTAQAIATQLSIPVSKVRAGVLPQDKAEYIKELQASSPSRKIVGFVGDGTNDTPALTVADVSIALSHPEGGGSDIAVTSSSFVLLSSNLDSILTLVKLSRRVFFRVKLNFMWAAIYNTCLLPVAAGVLFPVGATWGEDAHGGFRLSPVWASVAMAGSSVSVVLSSLALKLPELELTRFIQWIRHRT